jgi:hypothetical protein
LDNDRLKKCCSLKLLLYLIYLDESGAPAQNYPDPLYSLGGLIVCEKDWKLVDQNIEEIKKNHKIKEIHETNV